MENDVFKCMCTYVRTYICTHVVHTYARTSKNEDDVSKFRQIKIIIYFILTTIICTGFYHFLPQFFSSDALEKLENRTWNYQQIQNMQNNYQNWNLE